MLWLDHSLKKRVIISVCVLSKSGLFSIVRMFEFLIVHNLCCEQPIPKNSCCLVVLQYGVVRSVFFLKKV